MVCVSRIIFLFVFLACNVRSSVRSDGALESTSLPDSVFFLSVIVFGLSNGFTATSVFVAGPECPSLVDEAEKATAGTILSFWLTLGLAVGSALSFAVSALV